MAKIQLLKRRIVQPLALLCCLSLNAHAQVTMDTGIGPAKVPASGSDVVLLIRTKDFKSTEDIQKDVSVAAGAAGAKFDKESFRVEAIDYATWKKFASILGGFDLGIENDEFELDKGKIRVTQTGYRNQYVLQVPPAPDLESLKLEYRKPAPTPEDPEATKTEAIELKPGVRDDEPEKMPLRRKGIGGQFTLTVPVDWSPVSMQVKMKGEAAEGAKLNWPQQSLYLGRLNNFSGDLSKLFEVLSNRDMLGVPVQGLHQARSLNVVMADFVRPFASTEVAWEGNNTFRIRVPYDPALPASRVWFLFPMTRAELANAEQQMRSFPVSEYQFAKRLRGNQNPFPAIMPEDKKRLVATESSPSPWLVLPLVVNGPQKYFERTFDVENADLWRKRYVNEAMALYLYEFDTVEGPKVLPMAGQSDNASTRMYTTQEIPRWARGFFDAK